MNEALDEAAETSDPEDQASELAQAAEKQDEAADVLQKVADHFGRLEAGEDVTETRAAIRPQQASDGQQNEGNPAPPRRQKGRWINSMQLPKISHRWPAKVRNS